LGRKGIAKQIFLGAREEDVEVDYVKAFFAQARASQALDKGSKATPGKRRTRA
jgi:LysR family transcriptional regulator for metE and metH